MSVKIAPSLVSAPLERLGDAISELETAGADYIHFDIEDGSFVPVMNLGIKFVSDLRPLTKLPFDVHLMTLNPEWMIPALIEAGADRISVHYEACLYPRRVLRSIVTAGAKAGVAFNPSTPLPDLTFLLPYLSFVVILTSEPEIPSATFLPSILDKIRLGKARPGLKGIEWVADGGINASNLGEVLRAGVDTIVVGRAVFQEGRVKENISALRAICR
jgi:ribulose-phosphate 3-epimerase